MLLPIQEKIASQLAKLGIQNPSIQYQLTADELEILTIQKGQGELASSGALSIKTGRLTGRSPKDKYIVKDALTADKVWWQTNHAFDSNDFDKLYDKVVAFLSNKELFVRDCYVGADINNRVSVKVINETPWESLFCYNMFIRPLETELNHFAPEWNIVCAPSFMANPEVDNTRQSNFSIINFSRKIVLIGGSGYTGEMKKGMFSALNFILPIEKNILSMHAAANMGDAGDTALYFGLSGTGKTTLSADPNRKFIGDDEHGWTSENTIFNFEGGSYAKVVDITPNSEPEIYKAIKKGALLENVVFKPNTNEVDYSDTSITENTRVSYPLNYIEKLEPTSIGTNIKNIFFLTADSYGVLPPIAQLTVAQAGYHFISGYTSKIPGTEAGITEPQPNFSSSFGAPFMPLHPVKYLELFMQRIQNAGCKVWLVNTGWTGGPFGKGHRIALEYSRALITAALNGDLDGVEYLNDPLFGFAIPQTCPGVPDNILNPKNTWDNPLDYQKTAAHLATQFIENFKKYELMVENTIAEAGPKL